jgi:hypothetical protein
MSRPDLDDRPGLPRGSIHPFKNGGPPRGGPLASAVLMVPAPAWCRTQYRRREGLRREPGLAGPSGWVYPKCTVQSTRGGTPARRALRCDRPKRATVVLRASVSSDRRAQRGSRFVGLGEDLNGVGTLFAGSVVRFLCGTAHSARSDRNRPAGRDAKEPRAIMRPMRRPLVPGLRRGGRPGRGRPRGPEPPHGRPRR